MELDTCIFNDTAMRSDFSAGFPLLSEYMTTVRLMTGGVCAMRGLDVDYTEDVKVCVTEALLVLKRNGYARTEIRFVFGADGDFACYVCGKERDGAPCDGDNEGDDEISFALLSALVKESRVEKDEKGVTGIAFLI